MASSPIRLTGVVSSGLGEGSAFTGLAWARAEFVARLGFAPYPGTFNLTMRSSDWDAARARLQNAVGIRIEPPPGACAARCFPVALAGGVAAVAIVPEVAGYPADKLELLAPVTLREALGVTDGDTLAFSLMVF